MAYRVYMVPVITDPVGQDINTPSRVAQFFGTLPNWGAMDYGAEPVMLVGADLSAADDIFVSAQVGVQALPFDLTQNLSAGAVVLVQTWLEARNIPADWLSTSFTYLQLVKFVAALFSLLQAFSAIRGASYTPLFGGGITLATTIGSLSANARADLSAAAAQLGLSTAGVTGSTTIRAALKNLANQAQSRTFVIGPGEV